MSSPPIPTAESSADKRIELSEDTGYLSIIYTDSCAKSMGLDGARFSKFCKDANLFTDNMLRPEDVDLIFAKYKVKGKRYLSFEGFTSAIASIATKKNIPTEDLFQRILIASPSFQPSSASTFAIPTRFHDDISSYTGVHKAGGPSSISDFNFLLIV